MAIAHVQTRDDIGITGTPATNFTATAVTVTAGNLRIFVSAALHTGTLTATLSDGIGTTFQQIGTTFYNGSETYPLSMWYAKNCAGGSSAVKSTWSANVQFGNLIQCELSGADTSAPLDGTNFVVANRQLAPGTGTDAVTSTATGNYSQSTVYLFAYSIAVVNGVPTLTAGTNYTQRLNDAPNGQSSEERLPAATTGIAATFTSSLSTPTFYTGIAAFLPQAAATFTAPPIREIYQPTVQRSAFF